MKSNFVISLALVFMLSLFLVLRKEVVEPDPSISLNYPGCRTTDFSGAYDESEKTAFFQGSKVSAPIYALALENDQVLAAVNTNKWIEVDLSEQKLRAWEGDSLYLETLISSGLSWWPTPTGEFRIWIKLRATKMEGGSGKYYYYLPNVPYVMYFENDQVPGWKGYGLHGTYWHNDFGTPRSHGCVNLPTDIAEKLFYWVGPDLGDQTWSVRTTAENTGTRIIIHE